MSGKSTEKSAWTQDETQSALQHDGLSRIYTLLGLSHLSTHHSTSFVEILAGNVPERLRGLDDEGTIPNAEDTRQLQAQETVLSFAVLPNWYEIHNKRCLHCGNALFLGINCASTSFSSCQNLGIRCTICEMVVFREEPNAKVKREYRSLKCRQRKAYHQVEVYSIEKELDKGKKESQLDDEKIDTRMKNQVVESEVQTLKQRAAHLRKKSKEKKGEKELDKVKTEDSLQSTKALESTKSPEEKKSIPPVQISQQKKRKNPSTPARQSETLRLMLAQKRAKLEKANTLEAKGGGGGGLQDFLGSL